jgi:4-hydroxy-L-threonine phosphate dehydrogenase PdxA
MTKFAKPTVAVMIGDPAGIGPEVMLKALSSARVKELATWLVIGDRAALEHSAATCGISVDSLNARIPEVDAIVRGDIEFGKLSVRAYQPRAKRRSEVVR